MTSAFGSGAAHATPHVYGASELGVLAITAPGADHPRVEFVGGDVFIGLDHADDQSPVTQAEDAKASRPFPDAVATAIVPAGRIPEPVNGVIRVEDEVLAASVLFDRPRTAGVPLEGAPVVFAFARDRLIIVGENDEAAFAAALDLAEELFDAGADLVSAHPVILDQGAWAPYPWRERLPSLEMQFERVMRLFSVRAYEAQSRALKRPDVHYADPKIHVREDGITLTFAAWPQGTATLLPVVDNVMIADPTGKLSVTTFQEFLDAGGDAIVRTGLSPLRYFVPGEPPRTAD